MKLIYTLCFIRRTNEILMLFRNNEPNKGKWNGVGGKLEQGESPIQSCLREIHEETGMTVTNLRQRGIVTWNGEEGLYVFVAEHESGEIIRCDEGVLAWKEYEWVKHSKEVVSNISYFLDHLFSTTKEIEHCFKYDSNWNLVGYEPKDIKEFIY